MVPRKEGLRMRRMQKLVSWLYPLVLALFTGYVLLDTFVIPQAYASTEPTQAATEAVTEETLSQKAHITENRYEDENISITLTIYRIDNTNVYVADITLASSAYLKTALADGVYGKNITEKTSVTAQAVGAILAINGDYYGVQEYGFVLRNGTLYRDTPVSGKEDLVIFSDGSFRLIAEDEVSAQSLLDEGAVQILSFGPALVKDGSIAVSDGQEVGRAKASNPRTALGILGENHYLFVVSDGRTSQSQGLSLSQLAVFMQSMGAETAYNLDGGGSSTLYFNGQVVNQPTTNGKKIEERSVSDIVYIGY